MSAISKSKRRVARRLKSRRTREREGLALVEGPGVIIEALRSPVEVRWVVVGEEYGVGTSGRAIIGGCRERGVEVALAPDREVRELCTTGAPRAALACVKPPPPGERPLERGRYLMARGVQMPGNLGTLIRSAWAFGLDGVVIGAGTVDPWNPKVVRGSAGGVFHVPLIAEPEGLAGRVNLLCADAAGERVEAVPEARAGDWVLVVGNEGGGVARSLRPLGRAVAVPMIPGVDSVNVAVAGSILMHELMGLATTGSGEGR